MALHEKLDELRHSQILAMRDDIKQLADQMQRLEEKLTQRAARSRK